MKTSDFDYSLPSALIAQVPVEPRDHSRLLVLHRDSRLIEHRHFYEITHYLEKDDVIVFNNSRVIPARMLGHKKGTTIKVELLLLRRLDKNLWEALARPGRKLPVGTEVILRDLSGVHEGEILAQIVGHKEEGVKIVQLSDETCLRTLGQLPLPPYIHVPLPDPNRYQTVYAKVDGSVAAPTAGLHFTAELLKRIEEKGVKIAFVTLHIGLDTFRPVRTDHPERHPIHTEYGEVSREVATTVNEAGKIGRRVIAVGTSTVRLLEAAGQTGVVQPYAGSVDLFILPGYKFRIVNAMVTNFHLPKSTPLMLVAAFAGREFLLTAYQEAVAQSYRFYSFGDAMLIL
jgi:S-adenosylmethionine:tRNA ribosyltransferase-isomerase